MMKLNNKGQSLVLFIVILPIILFMLVLVYDIGNAIYEKNRLSNVNYMVINYALDNEDVSESDIVNLINKNINRLSNIKVIINDDKVNISLSKNIKGVFGRMFDFDLITAYSEYIGYIDNGNKIIEKVGWYYEW